MSSRIPLNIGVELRSAQMLIKLLTTIMEAKINKICLSRTKASFKLDNSNRLTLHKNSSLSITR